MLCHQRRGGPARGVRLRALAGPHAYCSLIGLCSLRFNVESGPALKVSCSLVGPSGDVLVQEHQVRCGVGLLFVAFSVVLLLLCGKQWRLTSRRWAHAHAQVGEAQDTFTIERSGRHDLCFNGMAGTHVVDFDFVLQARPHLAAAVLPDGAFLTSQAAGGQTQ